MTKNKIEWFRSKSEAIRTFASVFALGLAVIGLTVATQAIIVVNETNVRVTGLESEIDRLSDSIDLLTEEISNMETTEGPSWHVLHDERINDTNSDKFFIPPEASKIRVIWGESLLVGDSGPGYLCWEDGRDIGVCYTNISIPVDKVTEIDVGWFPGDRRLLFLDMGPISYAVKVHVGGWW